MLHVRHLDFLYELFVKFFHRFHDSNIWFVFLWKCLQKFSLEELPTCRLVTSLKQSIIFGYNSLGKVSYAFCCNFWWLC
jgi:hypothetical protein